MLDTIALSGDPAPGTGGADFAGFECCEDDNIVIAPNGDVGFAGRLTQGGVPPEDDFGFWLGSPTALSLVLRSGTGLGDGASVAPRVYTAQINGAGDLALWVQTDAPQPGTQFDSIPHAVLAGAPSALQVVAKSPGPPPDGLDLTENLYEVGAPILNDVGGLAFFGNVVLQEPDESTPGEAETRAWLSSLQAPTDPAEVLASASVDLFGEIPGGIAFYLTGFNDDGDTTYVGSIAVADGVEELGLWFRDANGTLQRLSDVAFATDSGSSFRITFSSITAELNNVGQVLVEGGIKENSTATPGLALLVPDGLSGVIVVRDGDAAPGVGERSFSFPDFREEQLAGFNDGGQVAFQAAAGAAPNEVTGIWIYDPSGGLTLLASSLDIAPGTSSRYVRFGVLHTQSGLPSYRRVALNRSGTAMFLADLEDGRRGIWAGTPGALEPVALTRAYLEIAPGSFATVTELGLPYNNLPQTVRRDFNDAGEIAFWAAFDDGRSAILRASPNLPPVADAGEDQEVLFKKGNSTEVTLDGSGSTDPNGTEIVSYLWDDGQGDTASGIMPALTLGVGAYVFTLTVSDGFSESTDEVAISVSKQTGGGGGNT